MGTFGIQLRRNPNVLLSVIPNINILKVMQYNKIKIIHKMKYFLVLSVAYKRFRKVCWYIQGVPNTLTSVFIP